MAGTAASAATPHINLDERDDDEERTRTGVHLTDRFWLYVVTQAATDVRKLQRIHNPAAQFRIDEDIFATGFIAPEDKWREQASDG